VPLRFTDADSLMSRPPMSRCQDRKGLKAMISRMETPAQKQLRALTDPLYSSWSNYLNRVPWAKLRRRCLDIAKRANRKRLLSPTPNVRLTGLDIWRVLRDARGRCVHCGSLAVENLPSGSKQSRSWASIGRRAGSLEHLQPRYRGGDNHHENLAWACMWCNNLVAEQERKQDGSPIGALDHGGFYPDLEGEPNAETSTAIIAAKYAAKTGKVWSEREAFAAAEVPVWLDDRDDEEFEMFPDHECPWDIAMGRM